MEKCANEKNITVLLILALLLSMTACGIQGKNNTKNAHGTVETTEDDKVFSNGESSSGTEKEDDTYILEESNGDILVAYFSRADNTEVTNPDTVDVDASTSASVLPPGNAAMLAGWIQEETGGDLFSIQVTEPYSSDYDECLDRAANEKAEDARPKLKTHVENMDLYNIIFLGFPNWWYTTPMAIHSFIEEYDFSGKTVIPFVTHGTGGLASCIEDLQAALPDSTNVLEPIGVYRDDVKMSQPEIQEWLAGLEIDFTQKEDKEMVDNNNEKKIRLILSDGEIVVNLEENSATDDLLGRLPLVMKFDDYNETEKISSLDSELNVSDAPDACTPVTGDLAYYIPWGNLCFFYNDFRQSPQLVPLGKIESGMEYLEHLDEYSEVRIEIFE